MADGHHARHVEGVGERGRGPARTTNRRARCRRRWRRHRSNPRPRLCGPRGKPKSGQVDVRRGTRRSRCCRGWRCRARRRALAVVSFTAEPTPAFESGTALMISPVAGAAVRLMPAPSTANAAASTTYGVPGVSRLSDDEAACDDRESGCHHASRRRSAPRAWRCGATARRTRRAAAAAPGRPRSGE